MKNIFIPFVLVLFIIFTTHSCLIDIPKEIFIDTNPFNNTDEKGGIMLEKESELIILIPDIQNYISYLDNQRGFESIIDRIIEMNQIGYKVKAAIQVGDITNMNSPDEWRAAQSLFDKLKKAGITYILTTGNHDYGVTGKTESRDTYFNDYFDFSQQSFFRESFSGNYENSLFEIKVHNTPIQIIALEFGPRNSVLEWADKAMDKEKMSILVTHAYLFKDKERYNWKEKSKSQNISPYNYAQNYKAFGGTPTDINDGEDIWQKLIYPSKNIQFVMCGHKTKPDYVGNLISENIEKKNVLQMLFNTQDFPNGGDGWMQILEFKNDKKTVEVKTYSSVYNSWNTDSLHQYSFTYN